MAASETYWQAHHQNDTRLYAEEAKALIVDFDLRELSSSFYSNPFPTYHALRTFCPIYRLPDGSVMLTRYRDLINIYRNSKHYSSDKKKEFYPKFGDSLLFEHHTTSLVFSDPPLHTRVRKLIMGALNQRAITAMTPGLVSLVDQLLDNMAALEQPDLIEHFASAIPIEVIGNLLNVPHEERGPLREWSLAILGALEPAISDSAFAHGERSVDEFLRYLRGLVADRRANPGDPEQDVLTRLIQGEIDGERLSETELLQNCIFILNAGHETTTNLIGNGLELLLTHPEQRQQLLENPKLIDTAIEEFLRLESSNQLGNRITTEEVTLGEQTFPADTRITLCIGAANRDPEQFPDPDAFKLDRKPNKHLAFAHGPHACAGMNVARLEGRIAIAAFIKRYPNAQLTRPGTRARRARFRGFSELPVTLHQTT